MEREFFFTQKDVKRLFLRRKKTYLGVFFGIFVLFLGFRLLQPPLYFASAVFKQAGQESTESGLIRSFLQNANISPKESGVLSILDSRTLLVRVIQDLGLSISIQEPFFTRIGKSAKDKIYAELGLPIRSRKSLGFSHVFFEGSETLDLHIRLEEDGAFTLEGQVVGKLGDPVEVLGARFTVDSVEEWIPGTCYHIRIQPSLDVLKKVRSTLKIVPSKKDKNILHLSFSSKDREVAPALLNHLMLSYQDYLKKENEEITSMQMGYLEKRQKELMFAYERSLDEHAAFLCAGLEETGFLNFKQEMDLLEKPSEDYLTRLYNVALMQSRLDPLGEMKKSFGVDAVSVDFGRQQKDKEAGLVFEGMTPEASEKLLMESSQEKEHLSSLTSELLHLLTQMSKPGFEITSLSSILTDSISQEIIRKAGQMALEKQDSASYSVKDLERLQAVLEGQKNFLYQHILQIVERNRLKIELLDEKIASLKKLSSNLLTLEKKLIEDQLSSLQNRMKDLPEKWKRESQLTMQKDLSLGVAQGLTQLAESKNIHYQLFQVESKPIDWALAPYKASKSYLFGQCLLAGILFVGLLFMRHFMKWLSRGRAITESSAKELGVLFCGFLHKGKKSRKDEETLRKAASFIFSELSKEEKGIAVGINSPSSVFVKEIVEILALQGLKVFLIDCISKKESGLAEYLLLDEPFSPLKEKNFDLIYSGKGYSSSILYRKKFVDLMQELKGSYDVVLLFSGKEEMDAVKVDALICHAEDLFVEETPEVRPLACVLGVYG